MSMMRSQLNDLLLRTSTNALVDENRNFLASMDIVQVYSIYTYYMYYNYMVLCTQIITVNMFIIVRLR